MGVVQEWDRTLRSENKSANTVRIYSLAAAQMAAWITTQSDLVGPTEVTAHHVRGFIADVLERTNAGNAHTTYLLLRIFFKWLVDEGGIDVSPMDHTKGADRGREAGRDPARRHQARAWFLYGGQDRTLSELNAARRIAPLNTRHHPAVRETVLALAEPDRRSTESLAGFARWAGIGI